MNLSDYPIKSPRKAKACWWCGEICKTGEPRHYAAWLFEGDFNDGHFHPECWNAQARFFEKMRAQGVYDAETQPWEHVRGGTKLKGGEE